MTQITNEKSFRVAFFHTVEEADEAVRRLLQSGFTRDELAVICPQKFKDHIACDLPQAERPGSHAAEGIMEGGAIGAALGGVALIATAITTGGVGLLPAIPVLLGGGALAGGFSGLIIADGYGKEIGEYYQEALRLDRIVVGIELEGKDSFRRLEEAERIMLEAGGSTPATMREENPDSSVT